MQTNYASLTTLPPDCSQMILDQLEIGDYLNLEQVSKFFNTIIFNYFSNPTCPSKKIKIDQKNIFVINFISRYKEVKYNISLDFKDISENGPQMKTFRKVRALPNLNSLTCREIIPTDNVIFENLTQLDRLKLNIGFSSIENSIRKQEKILNSKIQTLTQLKNLNLEGSLHTIETQTTITLTNLTSLKCTINRSFSTQDGFKNLLKLKTLHLSLQPYSGRCDFSGLKYLKNLEVLKFPGLEKIDLNLETIALLTKLHTLDLTAVLVANPVVIEKIHPLTNLKELHLNIDLSMNPSTLNFLARSFKLERLHFDNRFISSEMMRVIEQMMTLKQ